MCKGGRRVRILAVTHLFPGTQVKYVREWLDLSVIYKNFITKDSTIFLSKTNSAGHFELRGH